jgi:GTP pyrophosphokinase
MEKSTPLKLVRPPAREPAPTGARPEALAAGLTAPDRDRVRAACALAERFLRDVTFARGEPALGHALGTASIVSELKMDSEAVAAALLVPAVERDPARLPEIRERCGSATAELVDGVIRMAQISALSERGAAVAGKAGEEAQFEPLRKMLLAMVQDVRVVLVKLAGHLQELRFVVRLPDSGTRRGMALLTQDLFAPLANRLGVWQLKWEMEDLALRILEPDTYKRIAQLLDGKRADRERYIENVVAMLKGELARTGIHAEISGRPKHIFSIYKKMLEKDSDFESLYDVRAVRVLVGSVADCYAALGIIHQLWTPIPREFDDYIAKPKANHYRSLHTAVIGPEDKALEVQIRTREMHQHAELGIASHWRYKEGSRSDHGYDRKIAWLRQVLEWKDLPGSAGELAARFRTGLFEDTIYTLTPQGKVIALPRGATPIDFAYHVHSQLGHRCRGAMVDGAIVPLNTPLANGQRVEIMAAREGGPSRDWLNPALGYVRSHGARVKIRQWFNRQNPAAAPLQPAAHPVEAPAPAQKKVRKAASRSVLVVGMDRLLTVRAKCCKPAPPDAIVGFITRKRGVTIHRMDCANLKRLAAERRLDVEWGEAAARAPSGRGVRR